MKDSFVSVAKEAFKSFDKKNEERIKVGDIETVLKKLGHNIKPDWLEKIESTIDTEGMFTIQESLFKVFNAF